MAALNKPGTLDVHDEKNSPRTDRDEVCPCLLTPDARYALPVPEGLTTIARRFNVGFGRRTAGVPKGRLKCAALNRPLGAHDAPNTGQRRAAFDLTPVS